MERVANNKSEDVRQMCKLVRIMKIWKAEKYIQSLDRIGEEVCCSKMYV